MDACYLKIESNFSQTTEIESINTFGDGVFPEFNNGDTFLYRDSSGIEIEALQLSNNPDLIWTETDGGERTFHFTLIVTDDMLD